MPFFSAAGLDPFTVQLVCNGDVRFSLFAECEDGVNDLRFLGSVSIGFLTFTPLPSTTHAEEA